LSALVALCIANSSYDSIYNDLLEFKIFNLSVSHWINDGLMAVFFFLVGLEIKKELVAGELSSTKKATLPIVAAVGGMVVPAIFYFFYNSESPHSRGWGIPMATDIAFAVGLLTLFGRKVPMALKVLLLAVAIVDDLGAILVIALFYTQEIKMVGLTVAVFAIGLTIIFKKLKITSYSFYVLTGIFVWSGFLYSGVHATVAGVIMGLLTPISFVGRKATTYPLDDLIHKLHPWVSYGIMPLFAFSNSGLNLLNINILEVLKHSIFQGVFWGLTIGKPLGILAFSFLFCKLKLAKLPDGLNWKHILAAGSVAGIGFTMSLFISSLALPQNLEVYSKSAIVLASVASGLIGSALLKMTLNKSR
jgi:Na+:H+ antiporter, NhaA family